MDALTLPRLRARLRAPARLRRLAAQAQRGGKAGRRARERLGRSACARPDGVVIWVHAPRGIDPDILVSLRERLEEDISDVSILLTCDPAPETPEAQEGLVHQFPPIETQGAVRAFLDHWRPDAGIWLHAADRLLLLDHAARRKIPLFLQNAQSPEAVTTRGRNLERQLLGFFDRILAVDVAGSEEIRALGAIPARIETTGPLTPITQPPFCVEAEREALAALLHARPVWLAACPSPCEIDAILAAHKKARQGAHRLLLILLPATDEQGPDLAERLSADGWRVARRDADEEPDANTDVFIFDDPDELGLCYRLAPVSFLGGTLGGSASPNPMEPATLGSAIIAGPGNDTTADVLNKLERAGACRRIETGDALGATLVDLLSPDAAAALALNAWETASEGVQVQERLAHHLIAALPKESP